MKQKVTSLKNPTQCSESLSSKKPIRGKAPLQMESQTTFTEGILISMHTLWLQCKLQCDEWSGEDGSEMVKNEFSQLQATPNSYRKFRNRFHTNANKRRCYELHQNAVIKLNFNLKYFASDALWCWEDKFILRSLWWQSNLFVAQLVTPNLGENFSFNFEGSCNSPNDNFSPESGGRVKPSKAIDAIKTHGTIKLKK